MLDSDDWFDTANFKEFLQFLATVDVDLVISDFVEVNADGDVLKLYGYHLPQTPTRLNQHPQCIDMWMHAVTYRTENLIGMNYRQTEGISYTDQEWIFLPMTTVKSMVGFPKAVYNYLVGRAGQTVDVSIKARCIQQEIESWKSMQSGYEMLSRMGDASEYLWSRLYGRASYIYHFIILGARSNKSQGTSCLKELDAFITQHNPRLYNELEESTPRPDMRIKYIALWRKRNHNSSYVRILWIMEKSLLKAKRYFCK